MAGEKIEFEQPVKADMARKHERSTIAFPYLDLDTAIDVARALYNRAGHGVCEIDELAAQMGQVVSGAFRLKTSAAKMYGLIDKDGRSGFKLTMLGREAVQSQTEPKARAESFLAVPLYEAIYEKYRGHFLPPAKALEREMISLGVSAKQADKARQTFERSAKQAGFFAQGDDRLVRPRFDEAPQTKPIEDLHADDPSPDDRGGGGDGGTGGNDNPPPPPQSKPLEYQLVDLLKDPDMDDDEKNAVWTLVRFLTAKNGAKGPGA